MKPRIYRGWVITRLFPSGMYEAWKSGELRLKAETLSGIKQLIKSHRPKAASPPVRNQMDRARAAGAWLESRRSRRTGEVPKDEELAAFMSIFHPEIKGKKLKRILS